MTDAFATLMPIDAAPAVAGLETGERSLRIRWSDGRDSAFGYLWLRDNCICDLCGDPSIGRKRLATARIPADIVPAEVGVGAEGRVAVDWAPDGHRSLYEAAWLLAHCPSPERRRARRSAPILWAAPRPGHPPEADYGRVRDDPESRLRLYEALRDHGLVVLHGLPPQMGELERFAELLGPLVETNFGRVFEILWTPAQKSIANSSERLLPHTDEPYRHYPPGIMMFHCVEASSAGGGASIFVDGFAVAEDLRLSDPSAFDLLAARGASFRRHYAGETDVWTTARLVSTDADGDLQGVRFNDRVMVPLDLPPHLVAPYYEALRRINGLYLDERRWCEVPLVAGDVALFDNHRVLHGRTGFSADTRRRHLRQAHVDRTEFHSRLRILGRRLGRADCDNRMTTGAAP